MAPSGFTAAVDAIDWTGLQSTFGSGEDVRDVLLSLASCDEAEAGKAWSRISETVLQHHGTVYPATAAAAPFLCQLVMDPGTLWRAPLAEQVAFVSAGCDVPHAPAGTARAVRDAVRPYVGGMLGQWGSADPGFDLALVAVSVAFPAGAAAITARLHDWFRGSEPPLRTALGLALGYHGVTDAAAERIVLDEVGRSICWVVRTSSLIAHIPRQSEFPGPEEEPWIDSDVPAAIQLARQLRTRTPERAVSYSSLYSFLMTLTDFAGPIIDHPC